MTDKKKELSHIDQTGLPTMVDVGNKTVTTRVAEAQAYVDLGSEIMGLLHDGEINSKKGPVIQTAIIAGTMAVKRTDELIPFCHSLPIDSIKISVNPEELGLRISCKVKCTAKTGVEMEAITGASITAITIYDMCKAISHDIAITDIKLMSKSGGKSDYRR
jgi:cyclic pyranopterin phosphate synthase